MLKVTVKVKIFGTNGKVLSQGMHMSNMSPICYGWIVMIKVKVFRMQVKGQSQDKKNWHQWKGLVTRNTRVKYESRICYGSKVMIKVKVYRMKSTERSCHKEYTCEI